MGTYYKVVCDELKESIAPGDIDDSGIKAYAIAHPQHPLGPITIFVGVHRWFGHSFRVCSDSGSDEVAYDDYTDITRESLTAYNAFYGTDLKHTIEATD